MASRELLDSLLRPSRCPWEQPKGFSCIVGWHSSEEDLRLIGLRHVNYNCGLLHRSIFSVFAGAVQNFEFELLLLDVSLPGRASIITPHITLPALGTHVAVDPVILNQPIDHTATAFEPTETPAPKLRLRSARSPSVDLEKRSSTRRAEPRHHAITA